MSSASRCRWPVLFLLAALVLAYGLTAGAVAAQSLSGKWTATPVTTQWVIGEWGKACGPEPSGGGAPGGTVTIQQTGSELIITGTGRTYTTRECWERYPGLRRVSHSAGARQWKTVCKTSSNDPRQATLTTTHSATDDTITFYEAGQYQFVIKGQNCTASVGRYRTYRRVQSAAAPEREKAPAKKKREAKPVDRCAERGPPARLEVRPARKLMRPGDTFSFRVRVADAKGCPLGRQPSWEISSGAEHATLVSPGTVRIGEDAPEGDVEISVSIGGQAALVTAEVASKERYEALLAGGGFDEAGEVSEAASVAIASESVGAQAAVAEDRATARKLTFLAVVAGVAVLLGLVGFLFIQKTRRAQARVAAQAAEAADAAMVAPAPPPAPEPPAPPQRKKICPVCGSQYSAESQFCGNDGTSLVPMN